MNLPSLAQSLPVAALDAARGQILRRFSAWMRPFVRHRRLRVHTNAAILLVTCGLTSLAVPLLSVFLLPLVLGVPHLLSDVRYLGPSLPHWTALRRGGMVVVVGLIVTVGLFDVMWAGAAAVAATAILVRAPAWQRAGALAAGAALVAMSVWAEDALRLALAHLHHAVALVVWWWMRPRRTVEWWFPLTAAAWTGALLGGAFDTPITELAIRAPTFGPGWGPVEQWVTPSWGAHAPWRFVVLYALGQSLHYGIWLRMIPDDARPTETPRTFRSSLDQIEQELGRPVLWLFGALLISVMAWALIDALGAWHAYMRLAVFHAWLELVVLVLLVGYRLPLASRRSTV
jgi:hypothetical protein